MNSYSIMLCRKCRNKNHRSKSCIHSSGYYSDDLNVCPYCGKPLESTGITSDEFDIIFLYSEEPEIFDQMEKYKKSNYQKFQSTIATMKIENEKKHLELPNNEVKYPEIANDLSKYSTKENIKNYFKVTNGYNFCGYNITKYLGLVSGEVVEGTGMVSDLRANFSDIFGTTSKTYSEKIKRIKKAALSDMISEATSLGANAIIGISYNSMIFTGNMIGISVNGTAVYIEPEGKQSEEQ